MIRFKTYVVLDIFYILLLYGCNECHYRDVAESWCEGNSRWNCVGEWSREPEKFEECGPDNVCVEKDKNTYCVDKDHPCPEEVKYYTFCDGNVKVTCLIGYESNRTDCEELQKICVEETDAGNAYCEDEDAS